MAGWEGWELTILQSETWTEAEDLPDWTESVQDWVLYAGVEAGSQWVLWRVEEDGWSPSGERTIEHTWPVVASADPLPGQHTVGQGVPWPEELQMSAFSHPLEASSKLAVHGSVGALPGSPGRTAGKTGGKVKPQSGVLALRLQLTSWGSSVRCDAQDVVPQLGLWVWGICPG